MEIFISFFPHLPFIWNRIMSNEVKNDFEMGFLCFLLYLIGLTHSKWESDFTEKGSNFKSIAKWATTQNLFRLLFENESRNYHAKSKQIFISFFQFAFREKLVYS